MYFMCLRGFMHRNNEDYFVKQEPQKEIELNNDQENIDAE